MSDEPALFWELRRAHRGERLAWIGKRPHYCNRGRWDANIACSIPGGGGHSYPPGSPEYGTSDCWPRYYFELDFARREIVMWLEAHGVDTSDTHWFAKRIR